MNVSSVYAYNSAISRLYGLSPASSVGALGSTSGIGNALSLAGVQSSISSTGTLLGNVETLRSAAQALADAGQFTVQHGNPHSRQKYVCFGRIENFRESINVRYG
jgi:hypothetical protein